MLTAYATESIEDLLDLKDEELLSEALGMDPDGPYPEMASVTFSRDGEECEEKAEAVFLPDCKMVGVAWGGKVEWTSCDTMVQGLNHYLSDRMTG